VNCDEMDGDRLRLPANRNCYRFSRVSWALSQISCTCTCMVFMYATSDCLHGLLCIFGFIVPYRFSHLVSLSTSKILANVL